MRLTLKLAALGMVLAFGMTACSDDSGTTPTPDKGMDKEAGVTPDMGATEGGAGDMAAAGGKCDNATDKANVGKTWGGKDLTTLISDNSTTCLAAGDEAAIKACLIAEVKKTTGTDISDDCMGCFADSALCAATNCAAKCVPSLGGDPTGADCIACRCGTNPASINCVKVYEDCSGLTASTTCN